MNIQFKRQSKFQLLNFGFMAWVFTLFLGSCSNHRVGSVDPLSSKEIAVAVSDFLSHEGSKGDSEALADLVSYHNQTQLVAYYSDAKVSGSILSVLEMQDAFYQRAGFFGVIYENIEDVKILLVDARSIYREEFFLVISLTVSGAEQSHTYRSAPADFDLKAGTVNIDFPEAGITLVSRDIYSDGEDFFEFISFNILDIVNQQKVGLMPMLQGANLN